MKFEIRLLGPSNKRYTIDHPTLESALAELAYVGPYVSGRYGQVSVPEGAKRVHITVSGLVFEK